MHFSESADSDRVQGESPVARCEATCKCALRTRRLIEIGAIFEKGFEISSTAEAEYLARKLHDQAKRLLAEDKQESDGRQVN